MDRSSEDFNVERPLSYLEMDNVRIIPRKIIFSEAYDTKRYMASVRITNCGFRHVLVRVCPPKSKAFRCIRHTNNSKYLAPGLSIKRYIKFTHKSAECILQSSLPIYINDKLIHLEIRVQVSKSDIALSAKKLDFGTIDIAGLLAVRTLNIYNNGSKTEYFAIDLPGNEMELTVEPMKGFIQPKECITVIVELMSYTQGPFVREFWIKTVPPHVVKVKANFIMPQLKIVSPECIGNITVMQFQKTYHSFECVKNVLIKNESSVATMFYVGSCVNNLMEYSRERSMEKDRFFEVTPSSGRMQPFQTIIVRIKFRPHKCSRYTKNYAVCMLEIVKIHARENLPQDDLSSISTYSVSEQPIKNEDLALDPYPVNEPKNNFIRLYIYGEMEEPNVELTPNSLQIFGLKLNETCTRTCLIKNLSHHLPITVKYNKKYSIEVAPKRVNLKPRESIEVTIKITPVEMCDIETEISFNLIHCENNVSAIVGKAKVDLFYSINNSLQKRNCENNEKHTVSFNEKCLCLHKRVSTSECIKVRSTLMPLSPENLLNIIVSKKYIYLGMVASNTLCKGEFTIVNRNQFPIEVHTISSKRKFIIFEKSVVVKEDEERTISVGFQSIQYGKFYVPFSCLVNNFHLIDIIMLADVKPNYLLCNADEIILNSPTDIKFVELQNVLNTSIDFEWILPSDSHINIRPLMGTVNNNRRLMCFVKSTGNVKETVDIILSTKNLKFEKNLSVALFLSKDNIVFDQMYLIFENIPLNTIETKEFLVQNNSNFPVPFNILNPEAFQEVRITPEKGIIYGQGTKVFTVNVLIREVEKFNANFQIDINNRNYELQIEGNTVFPTISITPKFLQVSNIVPYAMQRHKIKLKNLSPANGRVSFLKYPNLCIVDEQKSIIHDIALKPNEMRQYFIEFRPDSKVVSSFYLPFIINDLLGPSCITNVATTKYSHFVKGKETQDFVLPTLKVNFITNEPIIECSELVLNFDLVNSKSNLFCIRNVSDEKQEVFVGTSNLAPVFTIKCSDEDKNNVKELPKEGYLVCIKKDTKISFVVTFTPKHYGHYNSELPIYVRSYPDKSAFNYLKLFGVYEKLEVVEEIDKLIAFQTVPVLTELESSVKIQLQRHRKDCNCPLSIEHNIKYLNVSLRDETVHFRFCPKEEGCYIDKVNIKCQCSILCSFTFRVIVDNSLLLSYKYLMERDKLICDENAIVRTLEKWLYTQCLYKRRFLEIPYTIARLSVDVPQEKKDYEQKKKLKINGLPIIRILQNLGATSLQKYVKSSGLEACLNEPESTLYSYETYKLVLEYLMGVHILMPEVSAELLLPYTQYMILKNTKQTANGLLLLDEKPFKKVHKTCWIDLLLNVYKYFILNRIKLESSEKHLKPTMDTNCKETVLLRWLSHHYITQARILWENEETNEKQFNSFVNVDESKDCLMFATVTFAYCPYLKSHFTDLFVRPVKYEEYIHNACRLIQAWNELSLSYTMSPTEIIALNPFEFLMLTAYLYLTLPSCCPKETISIGAVLSTTEYSKISVKNPSGQMIAYKVILFEENGNKEFSVSEEEFSIAPKKEYLLKVFYTARKLFKSSGVLFFSGESSNFSYARNVAYNLQGTPDNFSSLKNIPISLGAYEKGFFEIEIKSPYETAYRSSLYFLRNEKLRDLNDLISWKSIREEAFFRPFNFYQDEFVADEDGTIVLSLSTFSITSGRKRIFLYFLNENVGDFGIQLNFNITLPLKIILETLYVDVKEGICDAVCVCTKNGIASHCPKTLTVNVPCKNQLLWQNIPALLSMSCSDAMCNFWPRFLQTNCGFRILNEIAKNMEDLFNLNQIFSESVLYTIKLYQRNQYSTKRKIKIEDVANEEGCIEVLIHWNGIVEPEEETLRMDASHGQEMRYYKLLFIKNIQ